MIDIKRPTEHPTGWMAFVRAYKEAHPGAILDYKVLMQLYIKGVKANEAP